MSAPPHPAEIRSAGNRRWLGVSVPTKGITDGLVGVGYPRNTPDELTISFLSGLFDMGGLFYNSGLTVLALALRRCRTARRFLRIGSAGLGRARGWGTPTTLQPSPSCTHSPPTATTGSAASTTRSTSAIRGARHPRAPNGNNAAGWGTSRLVARRQEAAVLLCGPASVDDEHVT
jgi:hypothetical protein